ncbi:hypothetical protein PRUB_a1238 [Pseudoalteromonas rubra]|uniref:DUF2897 domain-containing protein n=1 Tax=Pseudoalteromonas rubra TaxID=43658 RepID=A0A8T0C9G3_9GAMM|nr:MULTISPECIES: DUF2897 family protein [Pseudoalteromonas]KAF7786615.1 hypothetical protein PRUB_a1238 [Pseudoalteromonas rubra]MDK1311474.1 DUF2897 family protein [Pseudoalteromonas sp. R96]
MENTLPTWHVILIIVMVLGFIISNIMLLKYMTRFDVKGKLDKQTKPEPETKPEEKEDK